MKKLILFIFLIPLMVNALPSAQIVTNFVWINPTTNLDTSPLTDLAGVKIYCRQSQLDPYLDINSITINSVITTEYPISSMTLPDGLNYCVMTAFTSGGAESLFSNEVNFTIASGLAQVGTGVPLNTIPAAPGFSIK